MQEYDGKDIEDFLERFNCTTYQSYHKVIIEIAKQELIKKPHIMLSTWQVILSELKVYAQFQSFDKLETLYESVKPTNKKVLQLLQAQPNTEEERDALKFLQRYITGLNTVIQDIFSVLPQVLTFLLWNIYRFHLLNSMGDINILQHTHADLYQSILPRSKIFVN